MTLASQQKILFMGMLSLIGIEVGLALAYLLPVLYRGRSALFLDFNGLQSLPSWLQAIHLGLIGLLCLVLLGVRHRLRQPVSIFLPLTLSLLCFYGSIDEITKLHLSLDQYNWKFIYLSCIVAIPLLGRRDLWRMWQSYRTPMLWSLSGMGIFIAGGFGAEQLQRTIALRLSSQELSHLLFFAEHLRITVEELSELFGETLILYAIATILLSALSEKNNFSTPAKKSTL